MTSMTLNTYQSKYLVYIKYIALRLNFWSVARYDQPFLRYKINQISK